MNIKSITKLAAAVAVFGFAVSSHAIALTDSNLVGVRNGGYSPGTEADQVAQTILDLPSTTVGDTIVYSGVAGKFDGTYRIGAASSQSGNLSVNGQSGGGTSVAAGNDYILAKYDGPNGGAVLYYLGGAAFTLPADDYPLWGGTPGQYGLSGWIGYNGGSSRVPDGGATVALLGVGMLGLGAIRRKLS